MLYDIRCTPEQLAAAAAWANEAGTESNVADVELLVDDRMLIVSQGDDRAAFDTGGEPGSANYLAMAPLDRPMNSYDAGHAAGRKVAFAEIHAVINAPGQSETQFKIGDVVYCEGVSAILGNVTAVDDEGVTVEWRKTTTTEQPEDLIHEVAPTPSGDPAFDAELDAARQAGRRSAFAEIHAVLNAPGQWSPDTPEAIAEIIAREGFTIDPPEDDR